MGKCKHKKMTETLETKRSPLIVGKLLVHHGFGVYEAYCDDCDSELQSAVCLNAIVYESNTHH